MRFLTDQNVQQVVPELLIAQGFDVELSRDVLGPEAEDPVIAAAAMEDERILVSHDHDMKRIERYVSERHRERFPNLSRLMLACDEAAAAAGTERAGWLRPTVNKIEEESLRAPQES